MANSIYHKKAGSADCISVWGNCLVIRFDIISIRYRASNIQYISKECPKDRREHDKVPHSYYEIPLGYPAEHQNYVY